MVKGTVKVNVDRDIESCVLPKKKKTTLNPFFLVFLFQQGRV